MTAEREREERPKNFRKRARRNSGCLCFSSSSSSSMSSGNGGIKSRRDDEAYERNSWDYDLSDGKINAFHHISFM